MCHFLLVSFISLEEGVFCWGLYLFNVPEGDTIHKTSRVLDAALQGQTLRALRGRDGESLFARLPTVERVLALGKHCLMDLDNGSTLRVHLGMHGRWQRTPLQQPARGEIHLTLETDRERFTLLNAKEVERFATRDRVRHPILAKLGPDLLAGEPDWEHIVERALRTGAERPLGEVLLDQRVAAGLGNVYRNELCFLGPLEGGVAWQPWRGTSPRTPVGLLSTTQLAGLFRRGRELLLANLGGWPRITTSDTSRLPADFRWVRSWVYGRRGLPCIRCRERILSRGADALGDERMLCWCPKCQPLGSWGAESKVGRYLLPLR